MDSNLPPRIFQAPPLPDTFIERSELHQEVKSLLLNAQEPTSETLVISAIYGLGGIGKSMLAAALAHDSEIRTQFPDGILWVTLGQQPDMLSCLSHWIQVLGDRTYKPTTVAAASQHLRTLLSDTRMLLVIDDVWNPDHVELFQVGGKDCRHLVTTRDAQIPGAERYDMDVMSREQSLQLLLNASQSELLTSEEQQQAEAIAQEVGYLPLALELAGAQIANREMSWQDLLEKLQREIADLDALDVLTEDESPRGEEVRKGFSLIASFNLSLRQLSAEQLSRFCWLGVLPEDVMITPAMAATLWQISGSEAGQQLHLFWQKALLLSGIEQTGQPSYRLHDLMHDLAQSLLVQPREPENPGRLPGLGLTVRQAHAQLLEQYLIQTVEGQWQTVPADGYIHEHLAWHLERAGQTDELHQLLQDETSERQNAWYEACDRLGKPSIFVQDIARAWRLAEEQYEANPSDSTLLQLRYALIKVSLNSMASNIPPKLMAVFVKNGFWTPTQAFAYALQAKESNEKAVALCELIPHLPRHLYPELVNIAHHCSDKSCRAWVLGVLGQQVDSDLYSQAVEVALQIENETLRDQRLDNLAENPPQEFLAQALSKATDHEQEWFYARVLGVLIPTHPELYPRALEIAQRFESEFTCNKLLCAIAQHLPQDLLLQTLDIISQFRHERLRARALGDLVQHLPQEFYSQVLEIAQNLQEEENRAHLLTALAKQDSTFSSQALESAYEIQKERSRDQALCAVMSLVKQDSTFVPQALDAVGQIQSNLSRDRALHTVIEQIQHDSQFLPQVLEAACKIQSDYDRSDALICLADKQLSPDLFSQVLEIAQNIQSVDSRTRVLLVLAEYQSDVLPILLESAQQMEDQEYCYRWLSSLAPQYSELYPFVLENLRHLDEWQCINVLEELAQHLPSQWFPEVLEIIEHVQFDPSSRLRVLSAVAPRQPELYPQTLETIQQISYEYDRSKALGSIAEQLPTHLYPQALEVARRISDEHDRARALSQLAKQCPALLPQAFEVAQQISDADDRACVLSSLAQQDPEFYPQALDAAKQIQGWGLERRAIVLENLIPDLPQTFYDEILEEALEIAQQFLDEGGLGHLNMLRALAPHLPKELVSRFLDVTQQIEIEDAEDKVMILCALAQQRPEFFSTALEAAQHIQDGKERLSATSKVLTNLAGYLPKELFPEALEIAWHIQDELYRVRALRSLVEHLPRDLANQVLNTVRQGQFDYVRATVLITLAQQYPELFPEAIEATQQIQDRLKQSFALRDLSRNLPQALLEPFMEATQGISRKQRFAVLKVLLPRHPELFSKTVELAEQIDDPDSLFEERLMVFVEDAPKDCLPEVLQILRLKFIDLVWEARLISKLAHEKYPDLWPQALGTTRQIHDESERADVLSELVGTLPESLLFECLAIARQIQDEYYRSVVFSKLAPRLLSQQCSPGLWQELLQGSAACTRPEFLRNINGLSKAITQLGGEDVIPSVAQTIQDVARQWP